MHRSIADAVETADVLQVDWSDQLSNIIFTHDADV